MLACILYQLNKLIKIKDIELQQKEQEKEEKRLRAFMPHIFKDYLSEDAIDELKAFHYEQQKYLKSSIESDRKPPCCYYLDEMKEKTNNEQDKNEKKEMEKYLVEMEKDIQKLQEQIRGKKEIEQYEWEFVLWRFYKNEFKSFPVGGSFRNIVIDSYLDIFPDKKK